MPIVNKVSAVEARAITDEEKDSRVYAKLRVERANVRNEGARKKAAEEAAAANDEKTKYIACVLYAKFLFLSALPGIVHFVCLTSNLTRPFCNASHNFAA